MKAKIFLFAALAAMMAFTSCEDDYADSSSVHFYGETENPPLKGSDAGNGSAAMTLKDGEPGKTVNINDYAAEIEAAMGMSVEEVFAGLNNGSVRFLPVNPNRRVWDKTPANAGDNTWAFSVNASVTDADKAAYLMKFDPSARTLTFELGPKAVSGTFANIYCGFVKTDDSSYPVNFRLKTAITVADLSLVDIEGMIPAADYAAYEVAFADYAANIAFAFGLTDMTQFASWLDPDNGILKMYLLNSETGERYGDGENYTANGMGYWASNRKEICNWGADGFTFYVEAANYDWDAEDYLTDGGYMNIGRAPGIASGTVIDGSFVLEYVKDPTKTLTFRCTLTCE